LKAVSCPKPEKIFNSNWFVLRNFHGQYYLDADRLENFIHFREETNADDYFDKMSKGLPKYFKLAKIVPPFIIKMALWFLANKKRWGTQWWIKHNDENRIKAYYGSIEKWKAIPDWKDIDLSEPPAQDKAIHIDHGYDESKPLEQLTVEDLQAAAEFRGGKLISTSYSGNPAELLEWECHKGHRFNASVKLILEGGHWCPDCLPPAWDYDDLAEHSRFFAQVWDYQHQGEHNRYGEEIFDGWEE